MKFKSLKYVFALCAFVLAFGAQAEVKMPALFSDNAILQQQASVAIWGWADSRATVEITPSWSGETYSCKADKDGKWKTSIETPKAGGPFSITISDGQALTINDVLIGEVWLCAGQSNMEMPMKGFPGQPVEGSNLDILKSSNPNLRVISVPRSSQTVAQDDFEGSWKEASPSVIRDFSATAYYFGRLTQEILDVPVGLIDVSYGGSCVQAWMSPQTAVSFEDKQVPAPGDTIPVPNRTPTVLFNGMLNPVIGYSIKGAIWYQGETNYIEPDRYEELFPTMVQEWRELWGQGEFPFYYAQIAPFDYSVFTPKGYHEKYNSAYLRDAQRKAEAKIPNSGMIVLMDIGQEVDIHPCQKRVGGERFALMALGKTYGMEGFEYESPSFNAIEIKGSQVVVSFNHAAMGIDAFGHELTGFEIAGENKVFYPAEVFLRSKSVVLSSPRVEKPVAVRYAFKDYIRGCLWGTNGLPVSSFRSDDW